MHRIFLSLFFLLTFTVSAYASRTVVTQTPYYNYGNPYMYRQYYNKSRLGYPKSRYYNPNVAELTSLEKYALNRSYARENNLERLQRLEMQTFGAIQQGDFDTRYDNVRNAILSRPKAHTNSSVWRNIGNYFAGQMTGFTPQIDYSDDYYGIPNYGRQSYTQYSSPFGGHGIRTGSYGTSSGTGIRILD